MPQSTFRLINACYNTADGLKVLWQEEQAFRQEVILTIVLMPVIFLLGFSINLKIILIALLLLLLVVETLNSALENVIDRISLDIHPQSKIVKDLGSTAVGLTILMNVIAWGLAVYGLFY